MKTYHILPKSAHGRDCFNGTHYIDLPNGEILLCGEFLDKSQEKAFKAQVGVVSLPHPLSRASIKRHFTQVHLDHLATLGITIADTDTAWELSEKICTVHPEMRLD